MKRRLYIHAITALLAVVVWTGCSPQSDGEGTVTPPPPPPVNEMDCWLSKPDPAIALQKQASLLQFGTTPNTYPVIDINETEIYQQVEGFGFSLTGGSALVIDRLAPGKKQELLQQLFGTGENAIGVSYLRISIGASDLDSSTFSYNDLPAGQTDMSLTNFSIAPDRKHLIPVLKDILLINPSVKIMASPWSPPVWMKSVNPATGVAGTVGGSLQPQYYNVYARYLLKYIQAMQAEGIPVHAITPQNEPLHPGNNPSMLMTASQQNDFIKNHLGPVLQAAGIPARIIVYDHNCDKPEYPIEILNDPATKAFVAGSAFHLYAGDISALSAVRAAHPDRDLYFTEQWTSSAGNYANDLRWHIRHVIIGSMRNWSRATLEWNLANDASFGPHTSGGCTQCKGAITVESNMAYTRNVSYYVIAHVSKFVPPGSVRIGSNLAGNLYNVAFKTPAGKKVLVVLNDGSNAELFNIKYNGRWVTVTLEKGAVATFVW